MPALRVLIKGMKLGTAAFSSEFQDVPNGNTGTATGGILEDTVRIESILGQVVDTCEFTIFDGRRDIRLRILQDIVIVEDRGARATAKVNSNGEVIDIENVIGGSGYTSSAPPIVNFLGGSGRGAMATAVVDSIGQVTGLNLGSSLIGGTGYSLTPPVVTFGRIIFAGIIANIIGEPDGIERYWQVSCQDYTVLLDRTLVVNTYPAGFQYPDSTGYFAGENLTGDLAILARVFEQDTVTRSGSGPSELIVGQHVTQGLSGLSQQDFRYSTLREVVSQLAQYVGYDFYVDYNKELHYFYREDDDAPYILQDDYNEDGTPDQANPMPTGSNAKASVNYRNFSWKRDGTRVVNNFALFGDRLLADNTVAVIATNGSDKLIGLNLSTIGIDYPIIEEPGRRTIRVDVNAENDRSLTANVHDGADGDTVLTVAGATFVTDGVEIDDIVLNTTDGSLGVVETVTETTIFAPLSRGDRNLWSVGDVAVIPRWADQSVSGTTELLIPEGFDVLHNSGGKTLTFQTPPPNSVAGVRLRFTYLFTAGNISPDDESIDRYNRVFSRRVVASDVNSAAGMQQKLEYLKEQYADALEVITLTVSDDMFGTNPARFRPGQWATIKNRVLGPAPNKEYLIHRITTKVIGGPLLSYELEARSWEVDLL